MILLGTQNQFPSSFAPLGDLFKAFMFLSNLKVSILLPRHRIMLNGKVLPRFGRKKASSDSVTFSLSPLLVFVLHYLCVLLSCFKSV